MKTILGRFGGLGLVSAGIVACGNGTEGPGPVETMTSGSNSTATSSATSSASGTSSTTGATGTTTTSPSSTSQTTGSSAPATTTGASGSSSTSNTTAASGSSGGSGSSSSTATSDSAGSTSVASSDTGASSSTETSSAPGPVGVCPAQPGTAPSGMTNATEITVTRSDPNAFILFEGPAWADGALYFSEVNPNPWDSDIRKYVPGVEDAEVFLEAAGTNGLAVDAMGVLYSATARKREISKYDLATKMATQVFKGSLNSPNDIAIADNGTIYFSDPIQDEILSAMPQDRLPTVVHILKDGADTVLSPDITPPNGVTLSPANDILYVTVTQQGLIKKVTLKEDGTMDAATDFVTALQTPDGMTKDCLGNLYVAVHEAGEVQAYSPEGTKLATFKIGMANNQQAKPTNVAFGGADRKTLFITATYSIWAVDLDIAGYPD